MIMKLRGSLLHMALPGGVFVSLLPLGCLCAQGFDFYPRGQVLIDASTVPPAALGMACGIIITWLCIAVRKVEI